MKPIQIIQLTITIAAILIAVLRIIFPSIKIDAITIALISIAVIPWLAPLFKSVELPGGLKFEFQELERIKEEVKAAGLIPEKKLRVYKEYAFLEIADLNPQLALAGLRIELEKSLKALAKQKSVDSKGRGISYLMHDLYKENALSQEEASALADMIETLNRAVHGEDLGERATEWVIEIGPQILSSINKKIRQK